MSQELKPYTIEKRTDAGCKHCGAGELWDVVFRNGTEQELALSTAYGDEDEAEHVANDCNSAYEQGLNTRSDAHLPKPKCPDCNSVRMSHCSDPENCGGVYWPDHMYRKLETDHAHLLRSHEALREALQKAERCLTELYPSEPCKPEHEAEYYAVNVVINAARAALTEAAALEPQREQP
jgi:hypothetical protein